MFSVLTSAYTYQADLIYHSETNYDQNQIGNYLNNHFKDDMLVIMDENDAKRDVYFAAMTRFWVKSDLNFQPIGENFSYIRSTKERIYLITSKVLHLKSWPHLLMDIIYTIITMNYRIMITPNDIFYNLN